MEKVLSGTFSFFVDKKTAAIFAHALLPAMLTYVLPFAFLDVLKSSFLTSSDAVYRAITGSRGAEFGDLAIKIATWINIRERMR